MCCYRVSISLAVFSSIEHATSGGAEGGELTSRNWKKYQCLCLCLLSEDLLASGSPIMRLSRNGSIA